MVRVSLMNGLSALKEEDPPPHRTLLPLLPRGDTASSRQSGTWVRALTLLYGHPDFGLLVS